MSIFIADLGFASQPEYLLMAKSGIMIASIIAGLGGFVWLRWVSERDARSASGVNVKSNNQGFIGGAQTR